MLVCVCVCVALVHPFTFSAPPCCFVSRWHGVLAELLYTHTST